MICQFCKAEVTRYITKGPYCSVACKDHYEDAAEIAALKAEVARLEDERDNLVPDASMWRRFQDVLMATSDLEKMGIKVVELEADNEALRDAIEAAKAGGAL